MVKALDLRSSGSLTRGSSNLPLSAKNGDAMAGKDSKLLAKTKKEDRDEKKTGKKKKKGGEVKLQTSRNTEIIRVGRSDLNINKKLFMALTGIKGVGYNLAKAIVRTAGFDENKKLKELSEEDIKKIEDVIKNPSKSGIPNWMLNKRKDYKTGEDLHLIESDIQLALREEINLLRKIRCYRGIRHEFGLPVRGQRTRSSFRKGKTVGVKKKTKMGAK